MNSADLISIGSTAIVLLSGLAGMYLHWLSIRKKGRRNARQHFYQYLFTDNPNNGKMQIFVFASTMAGLYSMHQFDLVSYKYFVEALKNGYWFWPTMNGIFVAVGAGYICDSAVASGVSSKETIEEMK